MPRNVFGGLNDQEIPMIVCGIDIQGKNVVAVVGALNDDGNFHATVAPGKIAIVDENDASQLRSVKVTVEGLLREHRVEHVGIKARTKGKFPPGAASYKLEAVLQLIEVCSVEIVHPKTMKAALKDADVTVDIKVNKYAEDALGVAAASAIIRSKS